MYDLPFVWGYPQIAEAPEELQADTGNLGIPMVYYDEMDKEWSDYIITLWTNFAKYGFVFCSLNNSNDHVSVVCVK